MVVSVAAPFDAPSDLQRERRPPALWSGSGRDDSIGAPCRRFIIEEEAGDAGADEELDAELGAAGEEEQLPG